MTRQRINVSSIGRVASSVFVSGFGFTLVELLTVIAVIGVLACLILPVLGKAKAKAHAVTCLSNLRQLQIGWTLFTSEHEEKLPPNSDGQDAGRDADHPSWAAGNLEIGPASDANDTSLLVGERYSEFGSIGGYVKNPNVYRCPSDKSDRARSISMNAYLNGLGLWQHSNYVTARVSADIHDPANIWVFMDEREDSINDGYFAVEMSTHYAIIDYPSNQHSGAANIVFGDGHTERHRWIEPTTSPSLRRGGRLPGGLKQTSSADHDMQWLTAHTTVEKEPVTPAP
jgi:prepilin-type N-terminal cleavage/methylation domain-containing protein/prepilin-type processing-associated H-X9-DG protein